MFNTKSAIFAIVAVFMMSGCSSNNTSAEVATQMCKVTKKLDFKAMQELADPAYKLQLTKIENRIKNNEKAMQEVKDFVSTINCDEFIEKQGKHNLVYKFKYAKGNVNVNVYQPEGEERFYVRTML